MKLKLSTKKILIIEDYPAMRKAIKNMLYALEAQDIVEAKDADTALKAMTEKKFDIVLCDYNLGPDKNGQQILEEARHLKILPFNAIFIIVTSEQTPGMVLGAMENKPDEYMTKPFNAQQILTRLQKNYTRKNYLLNVEREIDRGNLALAIQHCDKLLASNDKKMHTLLLKIRAELALNVGELTKATDIYNEILQQRELPWARLGLGIIDFHQNNFEHAIETFQNLVNSNPMFMESYDWLSKAYLADEQPIKSQEILSQAIELSPTSILRQKKLAETAEKNNNLEVAEQAYKSVVQLGKHSIHKSSSDFSGLAKLYSKTDANKEALKVLENMRKEYRNDPKADLRAATLESELYKNLGDDKLSEDAYKKVQSLSESLGDSIPKDLQLDLAKAYLLNNESDKADQILDSLIKSHIDDDGFMDDIRSMQNSIGMEDHTKKLMQNTKQELIDINNRGVSLFKKGKIAEAIKLFEQAVDKMPDNKTILLNMVKIVLHDLKASGPTEEKILRTQAVIKKAKKIGVSHEKLGNIQMEFAKLTHVPTNTNGNNAS